MKPLFLHLVLMNMICREVRQNLAQETCREIVFLAKGSDKVAALSELDKYIPIRQPQVVISQLFNILPMLKNAG